MLLILGALFFLYQFIVRIFFSFAIMDVTSIYNIDLGFIGVIAGVYYLGYAISNLLTAVLFQRYSFLSVATYGSIILMIGSFPFCFECHHLFLLLGRFLIGVGSGMALPFVMQVIFNFYEKDQHSLIINLVFMIATSLLSLSLFYVKPLYGVMFDYFLLMKMLLIVGGVNSLILFIAQYVYDDSNTNVAQKNDFTEVMEFFLNKKILTLGVIGGLFVGVLEGFADLWGIYFFKDCYGIDNSEIAMSMFWITLAVGGLILRFFYDLLGISNMMFLVWIGVVKISVFLVLFYTSYLNISVGVGFITLIMIILGVCSGYQFFLFGLVPEVVGVKFAVLGVSLVNSINMAFGQVFHFVIAQFFAGAENGCTATDYINGFAIIPICIFLGVIMCFYYKEYITSSK